MKKVPNMKNIPIIRMTVSKAIVVAFVIAIITLFGSGVFNITQAQTPSAPSSPAPTNKTALPPAIKAKICDPNNPKLAFVNTTESNICGLPKSIKNVTTTTPTTPTPTPSSPKPITPTPSETTPTPQEPIPGLP
jgi:cell division protein FtsI/penicillin-binding protein 2